MFNTSRYLSKSLAVIMIIFSFFTFSACGSFFEDGPVFYEDTEGSTSENPTSTEQAISDGSNSVATEVSSPAGTYKWNQTFIESNYSQEAAFAAETAVIVTNSDNSAMINDFITCRLNNDELIIDYVLGDAGNAITSGTLKITTSNGKKHLEGLVKTSNSDGFYVTELWVMDEN